MSTDDTQPPIPDGLEVEFHGVKTWYYATIDGRPFKVCNDQEDGELIVQELVGNEWQNRCPLAYSTVADTIFANAE